MKKMSCEVILDLLPLYEDGCCSKESKRIVEEHLQECECCRKQCMHFRMELPVEKQENEPEEAVIRKWSRRWKRKQKALTLFAVLCAALLLVKPILNEERGSGRGFSNLDEIRQVKQFCRQITQGDYEAAYECLDMEGYYTALVERSETVNDPEDRIAQKGFDWYDAACRKAFIDGMEELEQNGWGLSGYQFSAAYKFQEDGADRWQIQMKLKMQEGSVAYVDLPVSGKLLLPVSGVQGDVPQKVRKTWLFTHNDAVMEVMYEGTDVDWKNIKY